MIMNEASAICISIGAILLTTGAKWWIAWGLIVVGVCFIRIYTSRTQALADEAQELGVRKLRLEVEILEKKSRR